jgi:hypothetical protein
VFLDEVRLERGRDFVRRLQRVIDGPVPCSVVNHAASIAQWVLRHAGRLYPHRRRGVESASFSYDDRYLADSDSYALDPALPLVTGSLQTPVGRALFGAFR